MNIPSPGRGLVGAMMISIYACLPGAALAQPTLPTIPPGLFNVTSYGAVGDGVSTNTTAIQNTVNAAAAAGGGTVQVPAGTYLCGPITLTNSIKLLLNTGATLKMLPFAAFPANTNFVNGTGLHDVQISGPGGLDGQGSAWWAATSTNSTLVRPALISLDSCHRVLVQSVVLQSPPGEHLAFIGAGGDLTAASVIVNTPANVGDTSGIHVTGTNCLVRDCTISNPNDDNIQIVANSGVVSDVVITNCSLGSGHGLSLGSPTMNGISNVTVINCSFNGTQNGIRLKSDRDRGGMVQNISCFNLNMTDVRIPIIIHGYYNSYGANGVTPAIAAANTAQPVIATTPIWRNITISNLTATTVGGYVAGIIWGRPEMPVTNVTLMKIHIDSSKSFDVYNAQGVRFSDSQINVSGATTYALFNAGIEVSNSTGAVTFDGLTTTQTNNFITLAGTAASLSNTNVIGNRPVLGLSGSTLTINNNLLLLDTAVLNFAVGSAVSRMAVNGNLTLGGRLNVSAAAGFAPGTYTLFTHTGSLSANTLMLGTHPPGYACSLATDVAGQVNLLVQTATPPQFSSMMIDSGNLLFAGTGGPSNVAYVVLTSTNSALPRTQWLPVGTNWFGSSGEFSFSAPINPAVPQRFYLLQIP